MTKARKPTPKGVAEQTPEHVERMMRLYVLVLRTRGRTQATTLEEFYGFRPSDVTIMYLQKHGVKRGLWFRLKNGRAVRAHGRLSGKPRIPSAVRQ